MNIAVIGTGYVGLVTGACLAQKHKVICVDTDTSRIDSLKIGHIPFFEPGLANLVSKAIYDDTLEFTTHLETALNGSYVVFICVGTPQDPNGQADLTALWDVVKSIQESSTTPKIVVIKSTVPPGTNAAVETYLQAGDVKHHVASNPEFLREGSAVQDCLQPDRVVIGTTSPDARHALDLIYRDFKSSDVSVLYMGLEDAEMTKYVSNCFLATKISFMNEMANLCEATGADIRQVKRGISEDPRIGKEFLDAGVGYGGSCFPKDLEALLALGRIIGYEPRIIKAVTQINEDRIQWVINKLQRNLGVHLYGKHVGLLGAAFKPNTDDTRGAPALKIIDKLLAMGAIVHVYDPVVDLQPKYAMRVHYSLNPYLALDGADAAVIVTEWAEFNTLDWIRIKSSMKTPLVIDGRNILEAHAMKRLGFTYQGVGCAK